MSNTTTDLHEIEVVFPSGSAMAADAQLLFDGQPMRDVHSITIEASANDPIVRCTIVRNYFNAGVKLGRMKLVYEGVIESE